MNRRVCVWIGSVLGCALIWRAAGFGADAPAWAQATPPSVGAPTTPVAVPTGPTAAATAAAATAAVSVLLPLENAAAISAAQETGTIAPFITKQLAAVGAPDVNGSVSIARQALMFGCPRLGNVPGTASPAFATAYSTELSAGVIKMLANPATTPGVKINLGVIVERVASNGQSNQLMPVVLKLLADRSDPVVYWGCKAAKPLVLTTILQQNFSGKSPLFGAVVNAVSQHQNGAMAGLIATEAFKALVVNPNAIPNFPAAVVKPKLTPLYDPVLELLELRTALYANGVIPSPDAEANVPTFLTTTAPPPIYTPAQKARAVQDLVNLIDLAGQRATGVTNQAVINQLRSTVQNAASALNVFSGTTLLSKVSLMPMGVNGPGMSALCATVEPLMSGPFPALKKPPTLPPTTAPAGAAGGAAAPAAAPAK